MADAWLKMAQQWRLLADQIERSEHLNQAINTIRRWDTPKMDFVGEQIEYRYECPVCEAKMMDFKHTIISKACGWSGRWPGLRRILSDTIQPIGLRGSTFPNFKSV
jgi:hypothetical protein